MTFEPVRRHSISDEITRRILRMILREELLPGDRLPPERDLAVRFNTNRNTLREAIRNLQTLSVLEARQGDGLRVRDFRQDGEINLLPYFLTDREGLQERMRVVLDMLEFRTRLLCYVVERLPGTASAQQFDFIEGLLRRQRVQLGDSAAMVRTDLEFSRALVQASGSLAFRWLFNTVSKVYLGIADVFPEMIVFTEDYPEPLEAVVALARAGDGAVAARRLEEHMNASDALVLNVLKQVRSLLEEPCD
jgi:GntR family transcriptional repressor for pyruvate dehydrogenase complex